jgi:DNA-binding MarR family transcriptional regulator
MKIPIDYRTFTIEDSFGTWLLKSVKLWHGRLLDNFQAGGFDVTLEEWSVLIHLWVKDGIAQQELAVCSGKNQPFITRAIDALEGRNLMTRIPDKTDRRIKQIYLTSQGRELVKGLIETAQKTTGEALEGVTEEELLVCRNVLEKTWRNLGTTDQH